MNARHDQSQAEPGNGHAPGRRRARVAGGRSQVHKVLVSAEEDSELRSRATARSITVPRLLVEAALAEGPVSQTMRRDAIVELFVLRRLALEALAAAPPRGDLRPAIEALSARIERVVDQLAG